MAASPDVLDLDVEHRVETNGEPTLCGDGLLGALSLRGPTTSTPARKTRCAASSANNISGRGRSGGKF